MDGFFIHFGSYKKKKVHRPPQNTIKNFDFLSKAQLPPDFFSGKSEALQSVRKSPKESHFTTKINKSENETFLVIFKHCDNTLFLRLAAGFLLVSKKILHFSFLLFLSSFSAKKQLKTFARPKSRFLLLAKCIWYKNESDGELTETIIRKYTYLMAKLATRWRQQRLFRNHLYHTDCCKLQF